MEEKKKSSIGIILIVVVLMIACLCAGYYLSYSNIIKLDFNKSSEEKGEKNSKEKSNTKEESKEEALDVTSEEVRNLVNKTISAHGYYCGFFKYYVGNKITPNDLEKSDISKIVINEVLKNRQTTNEGDTYTKKEVEDAATKLYGKDFKMTHQTIETCPVYTYDATNEVYTEGSHNCGGTCGPSNIYDAVKAIKKDNGLDLYVRMLFIGSNKDINDLNYYSDYQLTNKVDFNANDSHKLLFDYSKILNKGTLYKLTYGIEDDNYYFVSSEPVS